MVMVKSNGKVAFVTGASSGIGYTISVELAKRGYKVYAGARRVDAMEPLKEYGIIPISIDVSCTESIVKARDLIELENDHLDILLNNAGVVSVVAAIEVADEDLKKCYEVNLYGPIRVTREFRNLIIKGKGLLAYTSSTAKYLPYPFGAIYSSSKAGLSAYISTLAVEVKPFGVKTLDFVSGAVKTDIQLSDFPELRSDSIYRINGKDIVLESMKNFDTSKIMEASVYARKAVNDIEYALNGGSFFANTNYFTLFRGAMASISWYLATFLPRNMLEGLLIQSFKLKGDFNVLKKKHAKK